MHVAQTIYTQSHGCWRAEHNGDGRGSSSRLTRFHLVIAMRSSGRRSGRESGRLKEVRVTYYAIFKKRWSVWGQKWHPDEASVVTFGL